MLVKPYGHVHVACYEAQKIISASCKSRFKVSILPADCFMEYIIVRSFKQCEHITML